MAKRLTKRTEVKKGTLKRPAWYSQNTDMFPIKTTEKLLYLYKNPDLKREGEFEYQRHQKIIRDYMSSQTPYRGILLFHGLGSGKTCSSIAIAEGLKLRRNIIVLSPASLEKNYREELLKCGPRTYSITNKWNLKSDKASDCEIDNKHGKEYSSLSETKKKIIDKYITAKIDENYSFIHYDGIRTDKLYELKRQNYFDNKTIVVDEVHNLISMMSGVGKQGDIWYSIFMESENIRIIFLSGTPAVNYAFEYAHIFNILRGPMTVWSYPYSLETKDYTKKEIENKINSYPIIDFCKIDDKIIRITRPPRLFHIKEDGSLNYSSRQSHEDWEDELDKMISNDFPQLRVNKERGISSTHLCLPNKKEDFDKVFADMGDWKRTLFARRIMGLVSYYMPPRNENDFPIQHETEVIRLPMSIQQYKSYEKVRFEEISLERTNAKKKMMNSNTDDDHENSTFKIFSRAACNFAFPESIIRPTSASLEKTMEQLKIEAEKDLEHYFNNLKKESLTIIDNHVSEMSPKYFAIQNILKDCPGTALVYTVLRNMEGVGALTKVLSVYGWTQMKIEKYGGEWRCFGSGPKSYSLYTGTERDEEQRFYTKALFNNEWNLLPDSIKKDLRESSCSSNLRGESCKVLIITKTGAEGITLKNIRQVHVVESHWNYVRTKQVIGRAVRFASHSALPHSERNVRVYQYVTYFDENEMMELKNNPRHTQVIKNLLRIDEHKTSDEHVFELARKKAKVLDEVEKIIQSISFDCMLHDYPSCLKLTQTNSYTYDPDFEKDLDNAPVQKTNIVKKKIAILKVDETNPIFKRFPKYLWGKTLDYDESTGHVFENSIQIGTFDGKKFKKQK